MPELDGKVAIVTGAGRLRGIGRAASIALARRFRLLGHGAIIQPLLAWS